ncbi:MAG TPA: zinc ABC transporter substrate-binding protein [Methylomirabilota bacterium]|nr:zinc ABC transporter substrate-binding protein [Methylomirabilota bacterium]
MIGRRAGVALAALLALAGCREGPAPTRPLVVTTIFPLWDLTRHVAGDRAEAQALVPPGVEPHDWEPSPRDVSLVQRAAVFVHTGTGLDAWASRLVGGLGSRTEVVDAARGLSLLSQGASVDPHVWLDPTLARAQTQTIAEGLTRADPAGAPVYRANAAKLAARLDALDQAFAAGLRDCARLELVTSHAAFAYLARRYGLIQLPVMGIAPEAEPNPADLAAIVRTARERHVTHVFFEPLVSPRLAQTLAREIGATTLPLDPIEGVSREQAAADAGYVELMQANLATLRTGLGCR